MTEICPLCFPFYFLSLVLLWEQRNLLACFLNEVRSVRLKMFGLKMRSVIQAYDRKLCLTFLFERKGR